MLLLVHLIYRVCYQLSHYHIINNHYIINYILYCIIHYTMKLLFNTVNSFLRLLHLFVLLFTYLPFISFVQLFHLPIVDDPLRLNC